MRPSTHAPNEQLDDSRPNPRPELLEADEVAADGRFLAAIDLLTAANRRERDPAIEARLVELRYDAFGEVGSSAAREPWPPSYPDPFPEVHGRPPEVAADHLDASVMGGAILHHGCLVVRELIDQAAVQRLIRDIDDALAAVERWKADRSVRSEHFVPFEPTDGNSLGSLRGWVMAHNCVCVNDSPAAMFELLEALHATKVLSCIEGYLGERPVMSIHKSTFRVTRPSPSMAGWHQDGAFIGEGARPINIWMPLSDCGGSALVPGLDIIPRRMEVIHEPTGPPVPNRVPGDTVVALAAETAPVRPEFKAGDALLFDEMLVHATGQSGLMNANRYGIEFWLFAPSSFPADYLPMVI
jgi:hypothetical protein